MKSVAYGFCLLLVVICLYTGSTVHSKLAMDYMHVVYTYTKQCGVERSKQSHCRISAGLPYLGYCKIESCLAFSMTGSSLESWFENWGPTSGSAKVERARDTINQLVSDLSAARSAPGRKNVTIIYYAITPCRPAQLFMQLSYLQLGTMAEFYYTAVTTNMSDITFPGNSCPVDPSRNSCAVMMNSPALAPEVRSQTQCRQAKLCEEIK